MRREASIKRVIHRKSDKELSIDTSMCIPRGPFTIVGSGFPLKGSMHSTEIKIGGYKCMSGQIDVTLYLLTCWLIDLLTYYLINWSTDQLINLLTHQLINLLTHQLINSSTYQLINSSTHQLINSLTHQLINSLTHQLINSSTHQLINLSTHQLINLHQLTSTYINLS